MLDLIFLIAAIVGGTVMVCQFLLTLIGMGDDGADLGDGDVSGDADVGDVDFDGDADHATSWAHAADAEYQHHDTSWLFGVLSFRTLIAAAAFFGVTGKTALSAGYPAGVSLTLAVVVGVAAMYGMYWLMKGLAQLTSSGNEQISAAVGQHATVYVPIAEHGVGKVHVTLQNRTVEYQAVAEDSRNYKTGEMVEIVQVKNSDTVAVRAV